MGRAAALVAVLALLLGTVEAAGAEGGERAPLIRGGHGVTQGELPSLAVVAYLIPNGGGQAVFCTGTVISPRLVLTAAHCVEPEDVEVLVENFRVVTGAVNWREPRRQVLHAVRVVSYPFYEPNSGRGDAAVVELVEPTLAPALPIAGRSIWSAGDEVEIAGWGKLYPKQRKATYRLHRATVNVLPFGQCLEEGGSPGQICTEDAPPHKASTCFGDSGGPLLMKRPAGELVEIGIVHGGANCNPRYASVFTSTVAVFRWVQRQISISLEPAPLSG